MRILQGFGVFCSSGFILAFSAKTNKMISVIFTKLQIGEYNISKSSRMRVKLSWIISLLLKVENCSGLEFYLDECANQIGVQAA
jgi:hypothetical protein